MSSVLYKGRRWASTVEGYKHWLKLERALGIRVWNLYCAMEEGEVDPNEVRTILRREAKVFWRGELVKLEHCRTTSRYVYMWITVSKP